MGPAIPDYNKWLILLSVIQLSDEYCICFDFEKHNTFSTLYSTYLGPNFCSSLIYANFSRIWLAAVALPILQITSGRGGVKMSVAKRLNFCIEILLSELNMFVLRVSFKTNLFSKGQYTYYKALSISCVAIYKFDHSY